MRKIIIFLILFLSIKAFGQYSFNQPVGYANGLFLAKGGIGAKDGLALTQYYEDTATANSYSPNIKGIPGFIIRVGSVGSELWIRNETANAWVQIGGAGSITASNGITKTGNNITLGQSVGEVGDPALLTSIRELPLGPYRVDYKTTTGGYDYYARTNGGGISFKWTSPEAYPGFAFYDPSDNLLGVSGYHYKTGENHAYLFDMRGSTLYAAVEVGGIAHQVWLPSGNTSIGGYGLKKTKIGSYVTPEATLDINADGLTTPADSMSLVLNNRLPAPDGGGTQYISGSLRWRGQGWNTALGSQTVNTIAYLQPVQGNPLTSILQFQSKIGSGSYSNIVGFGNSGQLYDAAGSAGTSGQVPVSAGSGAAWAWGSGSTLTNGSGTTANGTAVDLGGTLTSAATIMGGGSYGTLFSGMTAFNVTDGNFNNRIGITTGGTLYSMITSGNRGGATTRLEAYPDTLALTLSSAKTLLVNSLPHDVQATGKTVMWDSVSKKMYAVLPSSGSGVSQSVITDTLHSYWRIGGNTPTPSTANFLGTVNNGKLRFRTNNTEVFVLDSLKSRFFVGNTSGMTDAAGADEGSFIKMTNNTTGGITMANNANNSTLLSYSANGMQSNQPIQFTSTSSGFKFNSSSGGSFFGGTSTASARVHIAAGTATAGTAAAKFDEGVKTTVAVDGQLEKDDAFYMTKTNAVRYGVGGSLNTTYVSVGNVGTGEDNLQTVPIKAGALSQDGDYIEFTMSFSVAVNSTLKVYFGAQQLFSHAATSADAVYRVIGQVVRTGAATQRATFQLIGGNGTFVAGYQLPTETLSGEVILKATGEGTSNDDIIQTLTTVKYFPAN